MQVASVTSNSITHALSYARRELFKVPVAGNREASRSGGEDGLYRVTLESGLVVEVTTQAGGATTGHLN